MPTSGRAAYLDSSAAVKLVVVETESAALRSWLRGRAMTSSALLRVEIVRAVRPHGAVAVDHAVRLIRRLELVRIGTLVLDRAALLEPHQLRALDAIHLATAMLAGGSTAALVSYDQRMLHAAGLLGLAVASPT